MLVNNAGISNPRHPVDPLLSASKDDTLACYTTNVCGSVRLAQACVPLLATGDGCMCSVVESRVAVWYTVIRHTSAIQLSVNEFDLAE
eukprot:SAG11_NODE_6547_length_1290_cov_3.626364_1_plen_88_part_00